MKNYFEEFYKRYEELKSDLELRDIKDLKPEAIKLILNNESKVSSDSKNAQTLNLGTLESRSRPCCRAWSIKQE